MPQHLLTIAARGHCVDAQSNALTLFSVLEEVRGDQANPQSGPFSVVTFWDRQAKDEGVDYQQRIRLLDPAGAELVSGTMPLHMATPRHRVFATVECPPLVQSGRYVFEICIRPDDREDWTRVFNYPFLVTAPAGPPPDDLLNTNPAAST